ncbi:MAG TPA: hypothetical protein VFR02_03785, partial [bacterium]|nr:hypothetical protein [bacterium]
MRRALKAALWGAGGLSALVAGYLLLLCFPGPLFAYHAQVGALTLYDDDPIAPGTAQQVLLDVQRRLDRCPLDAGRPAQSVFLCDREWQHRLLMLSVPKAGGV